VTRSIWSNGDFILGRIRLCLNKKTSTLMMGMISSRRLKLDEIKRRKTTPMMMERMMTSLARIRYCFSRMATLGRSVMQTVLSTPSCTDQTRQLTQMRLFNTCWARLRMIRCYRSGSSDSCLKMMRRISKACKGSICCWGRACSSPLKMEMPWKAMKTQKSYVNSNLIVFSACLLYCNSTLRLRRVRVLRKL